MRSAAAARYHKGSPFYSTMSTCACTAQLLPMGGLVASIMHAAPTADLEGVGDGALQLARLQLARFGQAGQVGSNELAQRVHHILFLHHNVLARGLGHHSVGVAVRPQLPPVALQHLAACIAARASPCCLLPRLLCSSCWRRLQRLRSGNEGLLRCAPLRCQLLCKTRLRHPVFKQAEELRQAGAAGRPASAKSWRVERLWEKRLLPSNALLRTVDGKASRWRWPAAAPAAHLLGALLALRCRAQPAARGSPVPPGHQLQRGPGAQGKSRAGQQSAGAGG